jgi:hypothetical protein
VSVLISSQDFLDKMPVGCLLPHAYDPLPIEFRQKERAVDQNADVPTPNPIGEAHGLFYDEPDIISRAEVRCARCHSFAGWQARGCSLNFAVRMLFHHGLPDAYVFLQIWAAESLPHFFSHDRPLVSRLWLWRIMLMCADSDSKLKEVVEVSVAAIACSPRTLTSRVSLAKSSLTLLLRRTQLLLLRARNHCCSRRLPRLQLLAAQPQLRTDLGANFMAALIMDLLRTNGTVPFTSNRCSSKEMLLRLIQSRLHLPRQHQ